MTAELEWTSAAEAARTLGVKVQTLYAYVSRGMVARRRVAGRRSSEYRVADLEALKVRTRRPPSPGPADENGGVRATAS